MRRAKMLPATEIELLTPDNIETVPTYWTLSEDEFLLEPKWLQEVMPIERLKFGKYVCIDEEGKHVIVAKEHILIEI